MVSVSSPPPPSTLAKSSPPPIPGVDFSGLPAIYVLSAHLSTDELHNTEDQLEQHNANITYDINEAKLVLGKVGTKKRAEFELRSRQLWTEQVEVESVNESDIVDEQEPPRKRARWASPKFERKIAVTEIQTDDSATESEAESQLSIHIKNVQKGLHDSTASQSKAEGNSPMVNGSATESEEESQPQRAPEPSIKELRKQSPQLQNRGSTSDTTYYSENVRVLKLQWLEDCLKAREIIPIHSYLIYEGRPITRPPAASTPTLPQSPFPGPAPSTSPKTKHKFAKSVQIESILERAKADASGTHSEQAHYSPAPHGIRRFRDQGKQAHLQRIGHHEQPVKLLQMTTSEYEGSDSDIPPPPDWVKKGVKYACQRVTPANPPNDPFIEELKKIRRVRLLTGDEIGVRAYSTSIASLAAYPYVITKPKEILQLPGCDVKIANLWIEWKNTDGHIKAAEEAESDETFKTLKLFYEIWGVGATTAREFYYDKGWRDLDDVVEYGWNTLSRVQQIGVKYYDEFQQGIPRPEVEFIAAKVHEHAVKVRDEGIELLVVGGYRRGKEKSGDVDMIVSHRHLEKTANLVTDIVASLETEGWVTHTLLLALTGTHRGQATLPFKGAGVASHGAGFDTLDKALVVWQDPHWPTEEADLAADPKAKNTNIHRRVDIIISPWRTVGCAITGWSGGTTFQRDLRRYVKAVKGWKFDSSGVRSRSTGEVVSLEGPEGVSGSMVDAERVVFEGMGLAYKQPWERCTG